MWTLLEALKIVRMLQPVIRPMGYHITLGGGVLNKGISKKDLDLFILRCNNTEREESFSVIVAVSKTLKQTREVLTSRPLRDSPDYGPDEDFHFKQAYMFMLGDRRIDVFVQ